MSKKVFNFIGWIILVYLGLSWIIVGYSSWYLLLLPIAYISFSISDGTYKSLIKFKQLSLRQITFIIIAFIASVAIVFSLILFANYIINDLLHLTGWIKTSSIIIAIIVALYPIKFTFGSVVYKVADNLDAE